MKKLVGMQNIVKMKKLGMKKICLALSLLLLSTFMPGCAPAPGKPVFRLDAGGSYTGFRNPPKEYTADRAVKDGCYVRADGKVHGGSKVWVKFVRDAKDGIDSSVRIVNFYDSTPYYTDVFYRDGFYRCFSSDRSDQKDEKFTLLLELEGTLPNAARSGRVTILTDDPSLTYYQVMMTYFSSNSHYTEKLSPFRHIPAD